MKVYIFFNDREARIPENGAWGEFKDFHPRTCAMMAAQSWRARGWEAQFIHTRKTLGFEGITRLRNDYPTEFLNIWFELRDVAPCWFACIDVLNTHFHPSDAIDLQFSAEKLGHGAISVQENAFATACMFVTQDYCKKVIEEIAAYERGDYTLPHIQLVSDEQVCRYRTSYYAPKGIMSHAYAQEGWGLYPLIHFPRSIHQWFPKAEGYE